MSLTKPDFAGIIPNDNLFQKLRLILSIFQDGSGQLQINNSVTLPGWRDFERSVAVVFNGEAQENKSIFDVIVPDHDAPHLYYGISCKMRGTLSETNRKGYVSLELSNSAKQFWDAINAVGLDQQSYRSSPQSVGKALLDRISTWHHAANNLHGGKILMNKSFFLTLSWDVRTRYYQLHQFPHELPDPATLTWVFPPKSAKGQSVDGKRIVGFRQDQRIVEWYGESGGQLKYYPQVTDALWVSPQFTLEPLPIEPDTKRALISKTLSYFGEQWTKLT